MDTFLAGSELPVGTRIHSYEVVAVTVDADGKPRTCVGAGGFGSVYKVERGGQVFACKVGHSALADYSPSERKNVEARAAREISALALLNHPNILRVHSFDRWPDQNGRPILITDWVEGDQLEEWRMLRTPSLRRICEVFAVLARALASAHRQGIFHRDLKCQNIKVRPDGQPIILDFGIARSRASYTLTRAGTFLGTCTHFSPEYCRYALSENADEHFTLTPQSELHSVGYMLFQLITGADPFPVLEDDLSVLRAILSHQPPAPSSINPNVPQELDALVLKLLAKDPAQRYSSGTELAAALDGLLAKAGPEWDRPLEVPQPSSVTPGIQLTPADARVGVAPPAPPPVSPGRLTVDDRPGAQQPGRVSISSVEILAEEPATPTPEPRPDAAILAAAEKLRSVRSARRAPSGPLVVLAVAVVLLLGIVLLAKLGPSSRPPENLLAKVKAAEQGSARGSTLQPAAAESPALGLLPPAPPAQAQSPASAHKELPELPAAAMPRTAKPGDPSAPSRADSRAIDSEIAARYGRPTLATNASSTSPAAEPKKPEDEMPPWLRTAASNAASESEQKPGPKSFGVPTGALIRARLQTNLDSRTVADGPVTARLMRPFLVDGRAAFPSGTLLFGQAAVSGQRFTVRFARLRLPDRSEVAFEGIAYDPAERKPGLAASRALQAAPSQQPSLVSKVARGAANTLLTAAQAAGSGDVATTVATEAGRSALNDGEAPTASSGAALFLDQGADVDVFVAKAF